VRRKSKLLLWPLFGFGTALLLYFSICGPEGDTPLYTNRVTFQQAIGGVGLGAVITPAWNFSDFDPRLQQYPADHFYPVPSGFPYSPDRLSMVSSFTNE